VSIQDVVAQALSEASTLEDGLIDAVDAARRIVQLLPADMAQALRDRDDAIEVRNQRWEMYKQAERALARVEAERNELRAHLAAMTGSSKEPSPPPSTTAALPRWTQIAGISTELLIQGKRSAGVAALDHDGRLWVLVVSGAPDSNPGGGNASWVRGG
jgi:hypothetical protein